MRSFSVKTQVVVDDDGNYFLNLPADLIQTLKWETGDNISIIASPGGQLTVTNVSTKAATTLASKTEELKSKIKELLPAGYSLESLEALVGRVGYAVYLNKPRNSSDRAYWSLRDQIIVLGKKLQLELELR